MNTVLRRLFLSLFVLVCATVALQSSEALAAKSEKTVILAASDFQSYESNPHLTCQNQVNAILQQIKMDYDHADGFLFAGDYYHQYNNAQSEQGINALTQCISSSGMGIPDQNVVLVQGNHDQVGTQGFSPSGNNDPANGKYGVFVIHEDDFMWFSSNQSQNGSENVGKHRETVQKTAERLASYLEEKAKEGFTEPIFVVSHLPLHYSMRTYVYGDSRYAQYIIDELNYGASQGLNIVYLFGHNHSHNWDNHLGGAAIYLERGDTIRISNPSNPRDCYEETLGFTYLNAGYVGYFTTDKNEPVDRTLTMTVYEFSDGQLTIRRYDQNGLHDLKAKGAENRNYYSPGNRTEAQIGLVSRDTRVISSPQTVSLVTEVKAESKSTCVQAGTKGYFITADGSCYADLGLTKPTTPAAQALPLGDHTLRYTDTGNGTHDSACIHCHKTEKDLPHRYYSLSCEDCSSRRTLIKVEAKPASCWEEGNVTHYYHEATQSYYRDRRAYEPLSQEQVFLPRLPHAYQGGTEYNTEGHWRVCLCGEKEALKSHTYQNETCNVCGAPKPVELVLVEAKESTCTQAGNRAYYYDARSDQYFEDNKATIPTTPEEQALPLAQHRYDSNGQCLACSQKAPDVVAPSSAAVSIAAPSSVAFAPSSSAIASTAVLSTAPPSRSEPRASSTVSTVSASPLPTLATSSSPAEEEQTDLFAYLCLGIFALAAVGAVAFFVFYKKRK